MSVLVTGGVGYIGSHTAIELIGAGRDVVIVDNLSNSNVIVIDRIEELTGVRPKFYQLDVQDRDKLDTVFKENSIDSVVHFAASKAVGESVEKPLEYYSNNLINTLVLLETMREYSVKNFVFSSSATVYGDPETCPILEDFPLSATNPYGRTKLMIEDMLRDICKADKSLNVAILRYFNPVGAHKSGKIGEDPNGIPNNLMPYITKVAIGQLKELRIFGNDYDTSDGTGVRDYIHVVDLANGHVKALNKLEEHPGLVTYNLGTGNGYSVLDVINSFRKASNREIPYKVVDRRAGDVAMYYANPAKAKLELGWEAKYGLDEMCEDSWRWQSLNVNGYENK
ncbi:UDP-glucose 4-epimerase [[Clostridium] sordellii]|uniref:UDP-glucose 4-epimerase GalE n=1 Tax=Paraclostridium sordellii TaxID=1505 RepID=UPI0005E471EE|nr:UDP-glucose 4-epimerase GalE [Paeniclostridium sordellii]CEN76787.1 UDP-glucose 4-epimerase [[Clostridium] sordellii] [Paeniclostridium sordellii]